MGKEIIDHIKDAYDALNLWYQEINTKESNLNKDVSDNTRKKFYKTTESFCNDSNINLNNVAFVIVNKYTDSVDLIQGDIVKNYKFLPFVKYPNSEYEEQLNERDEQHIIEQYVIDTFFEHKRGSDSISKAEFFTHSYIYDTNITKDKDFLFTKNERILAYVYIWRLCVGIDSLLTKESFPKGSMEYSFSELIEDKFKDDKFKKIIEDLSKADKIFSNKIQKRLTKDVIEKIISEEKDVKEEQKKMLLKYIDNKENNSSSETRKNDRNEMLDFLHKKSPIPIIPYYIQFLIDRGLNNNICQVEHLVMPISTSNRYLYKISNGRQIGVNTFLVATKNAGCNVTKDYIRNVQLFFSIIGTPIIDEYFYGNVLRTENVKSAIAAIMSRNMSHNLGSHVISGTKNYIANKLYELSSAVDGRGVYHLFQYLQERMDYVSMVINSSHNGYFFNAPLNLKADILDAFAVDGRDKRHNLKSENKQTKSFLLDYIVRSEHVVRPCQAKKENRVKKEGEIDLEIILLLEEYEKIYSFSSEANGDNDTNIFNKINFSVPFGLNSRHAFLTILENYIRNTAKHNKSENKGTLVISIFVRENPKKKDEYIIKIFNNRKEETFNGNDKLAEIKILKDDGSLNTENKGIKEMLICTSWLKGKTSWSDLEGEKNKYILTYENQELQYVYRNINKVKKEVEEKLKVETDETHKKVIKEQLDGIEERLNYYKDNNIALAIQFTLPKHKWVCYRKIENIATVYDLPSADFYAIEAKKNDRNIIKHILPHVIFVETEEEKINFKNEEELFFSVGFVKSNNNENKNYLHIEKTKKKPDHKGDKIEEIVKKDVEYGSDIILKEAINNEEILKLCYEYLYDKDVDNRKIFIKYANPNHIKSEEEEYRVLRNDKEDIKVEEFDFGKIRQNDVYVFNNHNDIPHNFADSYDTFGIKLPNKKFIEGISGASYNYNLLVNAPVKQLNYYRILEACDTKIAIVDERIYTKYRNLIFEGKISVDTKKEFNKQLTSAFSFDDLNSECKTYLLQYVCNGSSDILGTISEVDNLVKQKYQIPITESFNKAFLEEKKIYVYNYDKDKNQLIDLDGKFHDKLTADKFDYISVHYSIISDKFKSKNNSNNDVSTKYTDFIGQFIQNKEGLRRIIHSGRGGISDIANRETFVTLSTIEACVEDCKYKLAQLFLNLKYM